MTRNPLQLHQHQHEHDERHPDLKTAAEAVAYLRLDEACPSQDSAHRLLDRLCQAGLLSGITWGQSRLYARQQLDRLLERSIEEAEAEREAKVAAAAAVEAALEAAFNREMADLARRTQRPY